MITIQGKYNTAKVFTNQLEDSAYKQIEELVNNEISKDSNIAIMPDCHTGCGCVIGLTMTFTDKVVPNLTGVDLGCGVMAVQLENVNNIDFEKLDKVIRENVPSGTSIRKTPHKYFTENMLKKLRCFDIIDVRRASLSLGTIGSGNHFAQVDKDGDGNYYLVVHTGSRHLGKEVADYYQKKAIENTTKIEKEKYSKKVQELVQNKEYNKIQNIDNVKIVKDLAYCSGQLLDDYLHDLQICQDYAHLNRLAIIEVILSCMNWKINNLIESVHNYIDIEHKIIRKGAISAYNGETVVIPMNMAWGVIIGRGKGNPQYLFSASHGSGRKMSRKQAKENISLNKFKESMAGIYSTTVNKNTLDESPFAYKDPEQIIEYLKDTVDIEKILKPVYNFKG